MCVKRRFHLKRREELQSGPGGGTTTSTDERGTGGELLERPEEAAGSTLTLNLTLKTVTSGRRAGKT